jgi:hypothetical protein
MRVESLVCGTSAKFRSPSNIFSASPAGKFSNLVDTLRVRVRLDKNVPAGLVRNVFEQRPELFALNIGGHLVGPSLPDDGIGIRRARAQGKRKASNK